MNPNNNIEYIAEKVVNLEFDDFLAINNIIDTIIMTKKKNNVQHETKEQ